MIYDVFVNFNERRDGQLYGICPLHAEKTASFTVNEETGDWFCHGCRRGGGPVQFLSEYFEVTKDTAEYVYEFYNHNKRFPFPSEEQIEKWHQNLLSRPNEIEHLREYGITDDTIARFKLGFEIENNRISIPIRNSRGDCVNVRRYLPVHSRPQPATNKRVAKCTNIRSLGSARFFPIENLSADKDTVFIVEGEKDCLSAISQGFNAVTSTGGSNIPKRELYLFEGKNVYLMLDNDTVGEQTTDKYVKLIGKLVKSIHKVKLPRKDYADSYKELGRIDPTEFATPVGKNKIISPQPSAEVEEVSLIQSEFVDNMGTPLKLRSMSVVGTDPKIYTVPKKMCITCTNPKCNQPCPASNDGGFETDVTPRYIAQFVDSRDSAQHDYARGIVGCKYAHANPTEFTNVQKVMFQEAASFIEGLDDSTFETRYGLYTYNGYRLTPTLKYTMEAVRVTDPRSQQNYYIISKAFQERDVELPDDNAYIDYFKSMATGCGGFNDLINKHYEVWKPVLGIEGRPDLFAAIILTYLSVTEIKWRGGIIKGWLDTMVIGDTRTGKSQMLQRFIKILKLGGYINGENSRKTGVIGGVQRFGDSWVVTWGAIPMNDRGLLGVDEASGLTVSDFQELSSARSSGAVTINKIVKSEARARTRLVWISNPRSGRNLSEFYYKGFDAFREFIPVAEDQARFDVVISAAREDVTELQGTEEPPSDIESTLNMYRALVNYAWEIRDFELFISKDVVQYVHNKSMELGKKMSGGPLIVEVAVHEKILRLGFAIAVLSGSINNKGVTLLQSHIDYAVQFLEETLNKKSFGYGEFVEENHRVSNNLDNNIAYLRTVCATHPALSVLLSSNQFRGSQMSEVLGLDRGEHAKLLSELLQRGLIHLGRSGYYTPDKLMVDVVKQVAKEMS